MQKSTICGILSTIRGTYLLVHPKPIEPDSWQPKEMLRFLVTYSQPKRTEMTEKEGVVQKVAVFATPFAIIVPVQDVEIILDRLDEVLFESAEEIE